MLRHAWIAAGTAVSQLRPRELAPRQIRGPLSREQDCHRQ